MSHMANIVGVYCVHDESFCYFKTSMDCIIYNIKWSDLVFVWPCIVDNDGKEESQLDATITVYW